MEDKLFFVGQKAFLEKDGEILILLDPKVGMDFPGGKIQKEETDLVEALKREVREETGLEILVGEPFATWTNEFPPDYRYQGWVFLVGYKCKYISGEVKLSHEHEQFFWVDKDSYKKYKKLDEKNGGYFKALEKYFESL